MWNLGFKVIELAYTYVMQQTFTIYLLYICGSLITTWWLIEIARNFFPRWWLVDKPHLYPHERGRAPLPYPMWVILMINMLIWSPILALSINDGDIKKFWYVIIFWSVLSFIMGIDDQRRNISPKVRLGIQLATGLFFWLTAIKIGYISNLFGWVITLDTIEWMKWEIGTKTVYFLPLIVTTLWYALVMNAYNWSDNGKGMSSWLALTTFTVLWVLTIKLLITDTWWAARDNSLFVITLLSVLFPSIYVFWRYDVRKAFIVWDSGTMYLWFMIASLAIISWGKIATVAIVLWMYLIDAFYVVTRRMMRWQNPMKWDLTHLHHRLSAQGISPRASRWTVYLLSWSFWIGAIFLDTVGKILLFFVIIIFVIHISYIAERVEKMVNNR